MATPFIQIPSTPQKDIDTFRKTVLLAEILDVKVIVGFSGAGRDSQDTSRNWIILHEDSARRTVLRNVSMSSWACWGSG